MSRNNSTGASVERLYRELDAAETRADDETDLPAGLVGDVADELSEGRRLDFEEALVKESLDEVLLVLVALGEEGTHGKGLMSDLETFFGANLSPGTVYPRLHELEEEGLLEVHELVRTKEYRIADEERVQERIAGAMQQHLALAAVFRNGLRRF
jgi:DNA-binding transcriptional ArsR family regulator